MQQDQQEPGTKNRDLPDSEQQSLQRLNQASQRQVLRFVLAQLLTTFVLSAILLIFDRVVAYSSLAGGLTATLANAWFALKVFRLDATVAFVLIKPLSVAALLITYFIVHMTPAVLNVFDRSTQQGPMTPPEDEK